MLLEDINKLKEDLNCLVLENITDLTSKNIVELSQELDVLIAEYIKIETMELEDKK